MRVIVFAVVMALVCSILLMAASAFTEPRRKANEEAEKVRNFLAALEISLPEGADAEKLLEVYEANVKIREAGELKLYEYIPVDSATGKPVAVAIPFSGAGVWGPIRGVIATESDMTTVRGLRFYHQEETPGLGGEITSAKFLDQFVGKKLISPEGTPMFRVLKPGAELDIHSVSGITGHAVGRCRSGQG